MHQKYWFLGFVLVGLMACSVFSISYTRGSGDLITETRAVSGFDKVVLSGSGKVVINQGEMESLSIETDDNVMPYIDVEVTGQTLRLGFKEGASMVSPSDLVFTVGVDDLAGLSISGSGDILAETIEVEHLEVSVSGSGNVQIEGLSASQVEAKISGSGEIDLAGEVGAQSITISGSGKYLAEDMCSAAVEVKISGSGDATVCATENLDANISGSGSVNYYGRPAVSSTGSGSGRVTSKGE